MGQLLSNLAVGSLLKLNESGDVVKFRKMDTNHYGTGTGVTMLREQLLSPQQWNTSYDSSYNNTFRGSYQDMYCNVMYPLLLDKEVQGCLVSVPITVARGNNDNTILTLRRKGFLLAEREVGLSSYSVAGEATALAYFNGAADAKRIAYLDGTTAAFYWWLRSPPRSDASNACCVGTSGAANHNVVYNSYGVRPAFNLKSEIVVSSSPDADGCYTLENLPAAGGGLYVKQGGVWVQAAA